MIKFNYRRWNTKSEDICSKRIIYQWYYIIILYNQIQLCLIIILMQFQIILFSIILYKQYFKYTNHPCVHFSGNCQDFLLNVSLIIFFIEMLACFLFYFSCLLMISTFPFLLLILCVMLIRYLVKKRQNRIRFRNFKKITWQEEQNENAVCAICIQEYKKNEEIKVLPCDH